MLHCLLNHLGLSLSTNSPRWVIVEIHTVYARDWQYHFSALMHVERRLLHHQVGLSHLSLMWLRILLSTLLPPLLPSSMTLRREFLSACFDFLMSPVLCFLSLVALYILVLDCVDGRYPKLELCQKSQSLRLRHFAVVAFKLMECVTSEAEHGFGDASDLNGSRRFGIWPWAVVYEGQ